MARPSIDEHPTGPLEMWDRIRKAIYATKAIKSLKMENTLIDQKA